MLVDIVIAAMARLPALAHEPSRNFASVRLESWLRYGRASSLCANICASPALMSRVNIDLLPVALRPGGTPGRMANSPQHAKVSPRRGHRTFGGTAALASDIMTLLMSYQ
jgi:hypothetical protein